MHAFQAFKDTHVNLVDLTQAVDGRTVEIFPSEMALSQYTKSNDLFFPRGGLEDGNLLKSLRRQIMQPRRGR